MSPEERAVLLADAARRAGAYAAGAGDRPVAPGPMAQRALGEFGDELPEIGRGPAEVLARLDEIGSPATVVSNGGRYFGFVTGGTDPAAQAAAVLAGAWDQNTALPVMSPVAAHLDALAARWACELLGLPRGATATFCGGATIANLTAILAARDGLLARLGWSVDEAGLAGAPPLRVVTGAETHISVLKALRVAGFGRSAVTLAPTDGCGRALPDAFPPLDDRTLVVLQAGNVNTGHSDPFEPLIARAHEAGAWVHVDGAFGLWAAAAPGRRDAVAGVERADSWATDCHKWLNVPYDAGLAICARAEDLRRALATDAAYVATDAERSPMHLSLQMSQRARGIETWAVLAARGRQGIAELVEGCCALAERFAAGLQAAGAEILAPVVLNQALSRFDDDATTDSVIDAVQRDGTCWAGATTWQGRRAMRISVSDQATTPADVDASVAAIVRCWRAIATGTAPS
jgi:glutamate/tyrosine decarboxylase-like PLP-dependent enzyme